MDELADLKVWGETAVGWCAATAPRQVSIGRGRRSFSR